MTIGGSTDDKMLKGYEYKLDGATQQDWTSGDNFTISNEGDTTITARAVDYNNNKSQETTALAKIDRSPPGAPTIITDRTGWSNTTVNVTLQHGHETGSGIRATQYRLYGATNQDWRDYTGNVGIQSLGSTTIVARSIDNLGQVGPETSKEVLIDNIAPDRPNIMVNNINWTSSDKQFTVQDGLDSGGSGVLKSQYKIGNGAWVDYAGAVTVTQENVKIYARTLDRAGNVSQVTEASTNIDKTPPTTPTITLSDSNYTNKDVLVTLTGGQDDLSGIQKTQYRIGNNGSWLDYTEPFTITQEGRTTVYARSIDQATNISNVVSADAKIDRLPPSQPVISVSTKEWTNKDIIVTVTDGIDAGNSDVLKSQYKIGENGTWTDYTAPFPVGVEHAKVYARTLDKAGNIGDEAMEQLRLDKTPPDKPEIKFSSDEWANEDIQVSMADTQDALSGFAKNQYKVGIGGTWTDYDEPVTIKAEGQTMIYGRSVDKAGNLSEESTKLLRIDKTPPTQPTITVSTSVYTADDVTFQIAGSTDDLSDVRYEYRIDDGEYQSGDHGTVTKSGSTIITARAVDSAGNRGPEAQATAKVDKIPPYIKFTPMERDWGTSAVQVNIKYSDPITGVDPNQRYYKVDHSSAPPTDWDTATNDSLTITIPDEGEWYLHARAADNVGNVQQATTSYLRIQQIPEAPTLKVLSVREKEAQLEWSLPNGQTLTDGYTYDVTNTTTGNTWTIAYPQNIFTDSSLQEGTEYDYVVQARNHVGTSSYSNKVHVLTLPGAVTNIRVDKEERDPSKARISFDTVQSATYYNISAVNQETKLTDFRATVTGSVYEQIDNLQPGIIYDVAVSAVNPTGEGIQTHSSYLSLPDRATDFTSVQAGEDHIRLRWNTVSTATYYQLDRDTTSVYKDVYSEYEDIGLQPGTEYLYRVAAENDTGFGGYSEYRAITLPAQVQNFRTVTTDVYSLMTDWLPTKGAEGYYARVNGGPEIPLSADTQQFEFTSLPPGTLAELRIRAFNRSGYGKEQVIQSITLPQQPTDLKVEQIGEQSATVTWKPQHGASKYKIKINERTYVVSDTSLSVSGLEPGTEYTYTVQSGNAGGFGQPVEQRLITLPSAPLLRVKSHTATTVTFTWDSIQSAHAYHVSINEDGRVQHSTNNEVTFDQLQPGVIYHFSARSENSSGVGGSNGYTHRMIPDALALDDVKVINVTEDSVTVEWKPAPGSDSTKIYVGDQYIGETTDSTYTIPGLESGKEYEIRLEPVNSNGTGTTASVTADTLPNADYTVTLKPDRYSILFTWLFERPNEIFVISYKGKEIYRGKAREFNWEGLSANTLYEVLMWTENESGVPSVSKKLEARTLKKNVSDEGGSAAKDPVPVLPEEQTAIPSQNDTNKNSDHSDGRDGFKDIYDSYAEKEIRSLQDMNILRGTDTDIYEPKRSVTRMEFAAMIVRAINAPAAPDKELTFKDIRPTAWYTDELKRAYQNNVAIGFSASEFRPDVLLNREQASKMIGRVLNSASEGNKEQKIYLDQDKIAEWARGEIMGLSDQNMIQGYPDGTFRPKENMSRQESAVLIYRMLSSQGKK
ncbi:MAG: OmpL47-type beta-barrel domain-containing protein [Bacillota bacterium]